ncbi:uncharacterized protein LOC114299795 [Camellia sinensis]|uniref:uncharacterized protein LOC114299795 n=1 Tax=Camellia sinensis TaxID=4442 RepID=UPI00103693AC|nr:uncharacterized protein LOC114299795 [Camellia sinensis]
MIHLRPRGPGPPNPFFQPEVEGGGQQQQYLEPQVNRQQIMNIIQEMYGPGLRRPDRPMFRSPYPPWMETIPIPRNYRIPEFTLFIEEERQSTIEHVGRFILQCGELGYDDNLKLNLFPHSLLKVAFTWFINLPENSVHTWQDMENQFHAQFFRTEPEMTMVDLSKFKQRQGESAEQYIDRFKKLKNRCHVYMPEIEIIRLAQNGLDFELRKKFEGMMFRNLFELSSRATSYEAILREEQHRNAASSGTYYQEVEFDMEVDIDVAQVIGKKPVVCETLRKTDQPVSMPATQPAKKNVAVSHRQYSFDLSKADALFDELLTNKFLTLTPGHNIPKERDRVGKEYCKWHNSFRHFTNNCVTFRNCVQDLIQKGMLKYAEKDKEVMAVDSDPFPSMVEINMVATDQKKKGKNPRVLLVELEKLHKERLEKMAK